MNRRYRAAMAVAGACCGLLLAALSYVPAGAQNAVETKETEDINPRNMVRRSFPRVAPEKPVPHFDYSEGPLSDALIKSSKAREKLKAAKTDEEKEAASKELEAALNEYFEADLKRRADELENLRKQLAKMESYLKKRKLAKADIVGLQLESYQKEAEGLGFFPGGSDLTGPMRYMPPVFRPAAPAAPQHPELDMPEQP